MLTYTLHNGLLASLKLGEMEFINPKLPFGEIAYRADGTLRASWAFKQQGGGLRYEAEIANESDSAVTLSELALRFGMNSDFDWGVKGGERVIRHSFVSGDGSFFYFTPCDGHAPFLTCLPGRGTRFELFDTQAKGDKERPCYRALFHAAYEESVASERGCRWRQPVSAPTLLPGESRRYGLTFAQAESYRAVREAIYQNGQPDVEIVPGMTVPRSTETLLRVRMKDELHLTAEFPDDTQIRLRSREGDVCLYAVVFRRLGENALTLRWDGDKYSVLEFFVTLPIETLMDKRAAFIASNQIRDPQKWYDGLLAEHNNETGATLSPDNYDLIKGWRIYEVTCDDPGLSKPAFLSSKNAEKPVQSEIEALEYYVERFVWGGLQRSDAEEYPYGIYGIPDWKTLRDKPEIGHAGQAHLWRIYDYPHIGLMYYNLYSIGRRFPEIKMKLDPLTYLDRAYRTFLALYTYPFEIDEWTPDKTGLYNELSIQWVIGALEKENRPLPAQRLRSHWQRKAKFFVSACKDVFGSEYPFDTTGYESTQALAETGLDFAAAWQPRHRNDERPYTVEQARAFMDYQAQCNIACRGVMENAYHLLGSDYRNCSAHYTLSYMSQMGGQALMDYALYYLDNPFELLRLAYASMLSSWALMNAGDEEGYWFPGIQHNGAAGGGFENAPYGETWLEQPHHRGSWYYSCEIDLGFCGYVRGAATVLADDPLFGMICYGGVYDGKEVRPQDGVCRRFHHITKDGRVHLMLENARFQSIHPLERGYRLHFADLTPGAALTIGIGKEARKLPITGLEMDTE